MLLSSGWVHDCPSGVQSNGGETTAIGVFVKGAATQGYRQGAAAGQLRLIGGAVQGTGTLISNASGITPIITNVKGL